MGLKERLQKELPPSAYRRLVRIAKTGLGWRWRNDLNRLATLFLTDKWGCHWYTQHYQRYFQHMKRQKINLLEIGVGGYEHADEGGRSLRMWKAYFRRGQIVGIDLHDKSHFSEGRIDIRQCDQTDSEALRRLSNEYGGFDIIIDDGSHISEHIIKSFHVLFPLLRPNGIYAVEDTQTAYWPGWGGGMRNPGNTMEFFKSLVDGLNHVEYPIEAYEPTYFDRHIVEIAFFHSLIFIRKGSNDEKPSDRGLIQQEIAAMAEMGPKKKPVSNLD